MIKLTEDFFGARNDPAQISVNKGEREKLKRLHPFTMLERRTRKGPIAWALVFPTTEKLMKKFISKEINERELLRKTPIDARYEAIYLCSAIVLPEFRRRGIAKSLLCKAVKSMRRDFPVKYLFYWEFSVAGRRLARVVAKEFNLPLLRRL